MLELRKGELICYNFALLVGSFTAQLRWLMHKQKNPPVSSGGFLLYGETEFTVRIYR